MVLTSPEVSPVGSPAKNPPPAPPGHRHRGPPQRGATLPQLIMPEQVILNIGGAGVPTSPRRSSTLPSPLRYALNSQSLKKLEAFDTL